MKGTDEKLQGAVERLIHRAEELHSQINQTHQDAIEVRKWLEKYDNGPLRPVERLNSQSQQCASVFDGETNHDMWKGRQPAAFELKFSDANRRTQDDKPN